MANTILNLVKTEQLLSSISGNGEAAEGKVSQALLDKLSGIEAFKDLKSNNTLSLEQINEVLEKAGNISLQHVESNFKFNKIVLSSQKSKMELPYDSAHWNKDLLLFKQVINTLEAILYESLEQSITTNRSKIAESQAQIQVSIKECENQITNLKEMKGKGTNLRPDNDKRNNRAQDSVNALIGKLTTADDKLAHYSDGLGILLSVASSMRRWSQQLNQIPYLSVSGDLFKINFSSISKSGVGEDLEAIGIGSLGGAGLIALYPVFAAIYASFGMPALAAMGPVGWGIAAALAVVGAVLILVGEIEKANAYMDFYNDVKDKAEKDSQSIQKQIDEIDNWQSKLDAVFNDLKNVVRKLKSQDDSTHYQPSDLVGEFEKFAGESELYVLGREVMVEEINEYGSDPETAARDAARSSNFSFTKGESSEDKKRKRNATAEVLLVGYYIENDQITLLNDYYQDKEYSEAAIQRSLVTALMMNSRSPKQVVEKMNELGKEISISRVEEIQNDHQENYLYAA